MKPGPFILFTLAALLCGDSNALCAPQKSPASSSIDDFVSANLKKRGLAPSELSSDTEFLRRVYLDTIGLLPTPQEVRAFGADSRRDKRARLIDALLEREEHVDLLALKWSDLLRIKSEYPVRLWPKGAMTYYRWVRDSVAANKPYDQFVRELLTASGSNFRDGPVNFFRALPSKDPQSIGETVALVFMGARISCARCHAHPQEKWTPDDDLALGAFFAQVSYKATTEWKEEIVFSNPKGTLRDARTTNRVVTPRLPDGTVLNIAPGQDPRVAFADWLTRTNNPWFARNVANRIWSWLMGHGIVHEPDDLRPSNPPSNPELLDFLAADLANHQFDTKHLFRLILNSRTYQLSSTPTPSNASDTIHFSHHIPRRMGAEQLVDAVCQFTGVPETYSSGIPEPFARMPEGWRAAQLPDGNLQTGVLELFGSPPRDTSFETERCSDLSMRQALFFLNSENIERKLAASPRLKQLVAAQKDDAKLIEDLYLATVSRVPTGQETARLRGTFFTNTPAARAQSAQDLGWALLNSTEFMFIH